MVRVISVHHFTRQDVASLENCQVKSITKAVGNILLIGGENKVEIRNLEEGGIVDGRFQTVDIVQQVIYCKKGNFVCTLESKQAKLGGEHTYVRVYINWDKDSEKQPMRARIASRVTPSSQSDIDYLEMIEIMIKEPPECIACCQNTGNIAVSCGMNIYIYKFMEKDAQKFKFIDFEEIFEFECSFHIKEVALCEDIIGCISEPEVCVFQVVQDGVASHIVSDNDKKYTNKFLQSFSLSSCSSKFMKKDKKNVNRNIRVADCCLNLSEMVWSPTICYGQPPLNTDSRFLLFPSLVGSAFCKVKKDSGEKLGPIYDLKCSPVTVKQQPDNIDGGFHILTLISQIAEKVSDPDIPFAALQFVPIVDKHAAFTKTKNPLLPPNDYGVKIGISVFVTTPHVGHLYHVSLKANPLESTVICGGMFSYTAPACSVVLEPSLLHALTLTGLETYTLRPHPIVVSANCPENVSMIVPPHWEESVCLVGLRPFLNVEYLCLTESCLALVSSNTEGDEKSYTLYSLHLPSASNLYKEMIRVGKAHKSVSSSTYLHLLLEAYIVVLTSLFYVDEQDIDEVEELKFFLQDVSALLANYYANQSTEAEWKQAVQYYIDSGLNLDAIVEHLLPDSPGLVFILVCLLLLPDTPSLTTHEVFASLEQLLMENVEANALNAVALAYILVIRELYEEAAKLLSSVEDGLETVLLHHPHILYSKVDEQICLHPFTEVLIEYHQEVLANVFCSFISSCEMTLDEFVDSYMLSYPIVSCGPECNTNSISLQKFLEYIFLKSQKNPKLLKGYSKSVTVLIGLYLACLVGAFKDWEDKAYNEKRSKNPEIYSNCPAFLNLLPPFSGNMPSSDCTVNDEDKQCTCSVCCLYLLVLQSLMSSNFLSVEDRANVRRFIKGNPSILGASSLMVLSLPRDEQLCYVVKEYPDAVHQFGKDMFTSPSEWTTLLKEIMTQQEIQSSISYEEILNGILNELSMQYKIEDFIAIIPHTKHEEFRAFIRQCHSVALSECLKQFFVTFAEKILEADSKSATEPKRQKSINA